MGLPRGYRSPAGVEDGAGSNACFRRRCIVANAPGVVSKCALSPVPSAPAAKNKKHYHRPAGPACVTPRGCMGACSQRRPLPFDERRRHPRAVAAPAPSAARGQAPQRLVSRTRRKPGQTLVAAGPASRRPHSARPAARRPCRRRPPRRRAPRRRTKAVAGRRPLPASSWRSKGRGWPPQAVQHLQRLGLAAVKAAWPRPAPRGSTFRLTSVITPSVPQLPAIRRETS